MKNIPLLGRPIHFLSILLHTIVARHLIQVCPYGSKNQLIFTSAQLMLIYNYMFIQFIFWHNCFKCLHLRLRSYSEDFSLSPFYKFDAMFPDICFDVNSSFNFLLLKNSTSTRSYVFYTLWCMLSSAVPACANTLTGWNFIRWYSSFYFVASYLFLSINQTKYSDILFDKYRWRIWPPPSSVIR